jgi:antitoxin MazE
MALVKKLIPVGNSLGLLIDRSVLDLLGIDRDTVLELTTDGRAIIVQPADQAYLDRVRTSARKVMTAHRTTMKKLAG